MTSYLYKQRLNLQSISFQKFEQQNQFKRLAQKYYYQRKRNNFDDLDKGDLEEIQDLINIQYDDNAIKQLLDNSGIIRNKLKVNAAIYNAQQILSIQKEFGSFRLWLENNQFRELDDWVNLFKKTFKFTGKEITKEFLISSGILKGAHTKDCPIFYKISS